MGLSLDPGPLVRAYFYDRPHPPHTRRASWCPASGWALRPGCAAGGRVVCPRCEAQVAVSPVRPGVVRVARHRVLGS